MSVADPSTRWTFERRLRPSSVDPVRPSTYAVGRGVLIGAGAATALVTLWAAGATWFLVCRDDIAARFLRQQAELQYAYEDKVGALRARLDRVTSQKLLEQDGVESRVADLVTRQVQLENRHAVLGAIADQAGLPVATTGSLRGREPAAASAPVDAAPPTTASAFAPTAAKPMPAPDPLGLRLRDTTSESGFAARPGPRADAEKALGLRLAAVERSIDAVETTQLRALDGVLSASRAQLVRLRLAVAEAGLDPDKLDDARQARGASGGPFVPLGAEPKTGAFEAMVARVQTSLTELERLQRSSLALPFARPLPGGTDLTSGFGHRLDPFTRSPALHTGLDFRAEHGSPVRAAGAGRVVNAEYAGGYGNMVEVDHGSGVTSRYAHLASFAVIPGQTVTAGAMLGRVGSTGRSTGSHLHYEIRLDGEPVDPQRFLRAGAKLAANKGAAATTRYSMSSTTSPPP